MKLRKDGTPCKKPGRKPLDPDVKKQRMLARSHGRHSVQVIFPTAELADEANALLGKGQRAFTLLAALHFWHGLGGEALATKKD